MQSVTEKVAGLPLLTLLDPENAEIAQLAHSASWKS